MSGGTRPRPEADFAQLPPAVGQALAAIDEHKGQDAVVLDMREVSGFTDFMVLCSGRSQPHVQALVDAVQERLLLEGRKAGHVEGRGEARWVLLDYLDLIVHVFTPEARAFYQLERLWRDAPMLQWHGEEPGPAGEEPGPAGEEPGPAGETEAE